MEGRRDEGGARTVSGPAAMAVAGALVCRPADRTTTRRRGRVRTPTNKIQVVAVQLTDQGCYPTTAEASAGPTTFEAATTAPSN